MAVTKREAGADFPASDYADVPDPESPSTWKLRLTESPGNFTIAQVARAITALQPSGFRGNRVDLGSRKGAVIAKINAAIGKADGNDTQKANERERLNAVKELSVAAIQHGHGYGEKCDECGNMMAAMPMKPYGGAISFAELDQWDMAQEQIEELSEATGQFQALFSNIMSDDMMSVSEKAAAVSKLATEFQSQVTNPSEKELTGDEPDEPDADEPDEPDEPAQPTESHKAGRRISGNQMSVLRRAHMMIKSVLGYGDYEDKQQDNPASMPGTDGVMPRRRRRMADMPMDMTKEQSFTVFRDKAGNPRWLSFSSNAFQDKDKELFTTAALTEAVDYADKSGDRGPLMIYHIPGSEIGDADFQDVVGRFLIESGTFRDTEMGRKALAYFSEANEASGGTDDPAAISIGYQFVPGDDGDGQYDWLRIKERSVLPASRAANPWTEFSLIGGGMNASKKEFLDSIIGADLSGRVIAAAEAKTKELEQTVRFKEGGDMPETKPSETLIESVKALEASLSDLTGEGAETVKAALAKVKEEAGVETAPPPATPDNNEILTAIAALGNRMETLSADIGTVKQSVTGLESEVKALKESDDDKIAARMAPRLQVVAGNRATESDKNLLDAAKAKELTGDNPDEKDTNPVRGYVDDLVRGLNAGAFMSDGGMRGTGTG